MRTAHWPLGMVLIGLAVAHGALAWDHRLLRPEFPIIDPAPGPLARKALAFGDDQFLYRAWLLDLQNAGDTGGRSTPMRDYNYAYLLSWLEALRDLDPLAQGHLYLATKYFSQTPNAGDVRRLIAFVVEDVAQDPRERWRWMLDAAAMAEVHLHDTALALEISQRLIAFGIPGLPLTMRLLPALLLEKSGRRAEARAEVEREATERGASFTAEEKAWVNDILQRLLR